MPITCKHLEDTTIQYQNVSQFVYAYPDPHLITPLGSDYKFERCILPAKYKLYKNEIENFEVRPDDVFVTGFMKTGTNWCQEMIWLLNNKLNYDFAAASLLSERVPVLEFDILYEDIEQNQLEYLKRLSSPRHLKSHLPAGLLPKKLWSVKPKIIYISRGVKDVAISLYHHAVNFVQMNYMKNDFLQCFINNQIFLSPCHDHIKNFWLMRAEENILYLRYEDLKSNLLEVIKKVSNFLGKNYSDHDLLKLKDHLSIDSLRNNPCFNYARDPSKIAAMKNVVNPNGFIRKGIVGDYKEEMSAEMIEKFDNWTMEYNKRNGTCIDL